MSYNLTSISISPKHEHRLLGLLLISLHIVLWWNFSDFPELLLRIGLLIHFGIFILWQPLWSRLHTHGIKYKLLLIIAICIFLIFPNILLLTFWQIILLGLLGGRDLVKPIDKTVNLIAITFLSLEVLLIAFSRLFMVDGLINEFTTDIWFQYGALIIPFLFLFITTDDSREHRYYINFFHGLTIAMVIVIITLGSLVINLASHVIMPLAIFQMVLVTVIFILTTSWLWIMLIGEEGTESLWTRHLYNIGSSFEQWIEQLSQPIHHKNLTPPEFLQAGFEQILNLPWITGITWHSLYGENMLGHVAPHKKVITIQSTEITVYARYRVSASHAFQIKILVQLLEYFHQTKRREAAFAQQAHLQAIHETGAKLTHDIKNLLQSLHAITSAIEIYPPSEHDETQRLLQGQLPHLTQRLKRTLDKLQKPTEFSYSNVPINLWWSNVRARYRKSKIDFNTSMDDENILIPEDLFDNVAENLLQNALMKRKREPELKIEVSLFVKQHNLQLTVFDNGSPIPDEIFNSLFSQPVPSKDGFGIGLYHVVKHLSHTGYDLQIAENTAGNVCFELSSTE
ncbi:MAG: HAMP domain-containing histidine kinase [Proteobacteria bacterium]|nr:HAMP domain-containing histidine kinase [Pseudomonadota bacterium]